MSAPALGDLAGLWRRAWIAAPGLRDEATAVFWRQDGSSGLYVDLRVPDDLPDVSGARSLAELDAGALLALARGEGFAGTAAVADGVCVWQRAVDWRGPETRPDAGRLALRPDGLHETGIHADYEELWTRAEPGPAAARALTDGDGRLAVVVWTAGGFSLGFGDPRAKAGPTLAARLAAALAGPDRRSLAAALDAEFSLGVIEGGRARVTLSTNPLRVGAEPFDPAALDAAALVIEDRDFDGAPRARRWRAAGPPRSAPPRGRRAP